jgi:DNA polymerase III subunit beta
MKAICPREVLLSACQLASAAIPAKEVKPILKNLKAVAADGRCTLMATDLEIGIRLDVVSLIIQETGEAILPAAKLINILRETRDNELQLEADATACIVKGDSFFFEMPGEDPAQFPEWPTFTEDKYHELTAGVLREMIRRTVFAVAESTNRYSMSGVLWELEGDEARLVATDGHRLAVAQGQAIPAGGHTTKGQAPVVPTKAMSLLERNLMGDGEELVKVCVRPNDVLFRTETAVIYSRLVEGRFPNYRQIIPTKHSSRVKLPVGPFMAAIRQAAIMTEDDSKRVAFSFTKGKLTLEAQGQTTGRSKVSMPVELDGKEIKINFNPVYVLDMLKVMGPDVELVLEMEDPGRPAVFRCGSTYTYLAMPLT